MFMSQHLADRFQRYAPVSYTHLDVYKRQTQGNSVNALQDKWPDRYIGLLDCGVRIGQWGRHVHYLETHLIGDPTYRFINRALPGTRCV